MSSRWQMHRMGLIDFWYYDEEEFYFLDGRMLLRGSNGSGKSVTMQSFIPLILDGNMRPERLDPFGSRARKMENYLLEENDDREERTAYLYLEFKRKETEQYAAIGIGLRARRGKKLESWYFSLSDGRRIGRDFPLYRVAENKLPLSRRELKNRLGESGKLFETRTEYAEYVNRLIFGFESQEEYKELLELLIQLRTPKLSKDFKPSVINDILSNSLQTLSEEDLRPMSEAVENMDALKTNLLALQESVRAAGDIDRAFRQYNECMLYEKARQYRRELTEQKKLLEQQRELTEQLKQLSEQLEDEQQRHKLLKQEQVVLEEQKRSLADSDAAHLKEQEQELAQQCTEQKELIQRKQKREQEKNDRWRETQSRQLQLKDQQEMILLQIDKKLVDMETELADIPFDEISFLRDELKREPEKTYSFSTHLQQLDRYEQKVEAGLRAMEAEERQNRVYDTLVQQYYQLQKEREDCEREIRKREAALEEAKRTLTEQFYRWNGKNQEFILTEETLHAISRQIDRFAQGADFGEIRNLLWEQQRQKQEIRYHHLREVSAQVDELEQQTAALAQEIVLREQEIEPEPERSEEVRRNRERLKTCGISAQPFYRLFAFREELSMEQASRLEEALLRMGILDALVVSGEDRERILQMDTDGCDRYLFTDAEQLEQNLSALLRIDNPKNDFLLYEKAIRALSAVAVGVPENQSGDCQHTWIAEKGNYRLGALEGTITGNYQACFIGTQARERFRAERIRMLREQKQQLEEQLNAVRKQKTQLENDIALLQKEAEQAPKPDELQTVAAALAEKEYICQQLNRTMEKQGNTLRQEKKKLDDLHREVLSHCQKTFLPISMDRFLEVRDCLRGCRNGITEIQMLHSRYLTRLDGLHVQQEHLDELDADLEQLRYELGQAQGQLQELEAKWNNIKQQLQLTDYEAIREQLDACLLRLRTLPGELDTLLMSISRRQERMHNLQIEQRKNAEAVQAALYRTEEARSIFDEEWQLGYTSLSEKNTLHEEKRADFVKNTLARYAQKDCDEYQSRVQEEFHKNKGFLTEYQLGMMTRFDTERAEGVEETRTAFVRRRIDIMAKYRGMKISFPQLLSRLTEDVQEQEKLLSSKDRELFEDILANTISRKIRTRIHASRRWVSRMNDLMASMQTSSGLRLNLRWKNRQAEQENQLDTGRLVALLEKDYELMRPEEIEQISAHFRSKIAQARNLSDQSENMMSFHAVMREVLDYRKWFEFRLECQKTGENRKEMTDRVFFTFSGGEKAMSMYVPLFSAVVAKYSSAHADAPRIISLDEAFAGVDDTNIRDMFRLMVEFEFDFIINSQVLWGDAESVPAIAIYQLIRPENAKFVTVVPYVWRGTKRVLVQDMRKESEE